MRVEWASGCAVYWPKKRGQTPIFRPRFSTAGLSLGLGLLLRLILVTQPFTEIIEPGLTLPVLGLALAGVLFRGNSRFGRLPHVWLAGALAMTVIAGGRYHHPWYHVPLVPMAAMLAALSWQRLQAMKMLAAPKVRMALAIAFFVVMTPRAAAHVQELYVPWAVPLQNLGLELHRIAPSDALV